jgi:hypothetical protein
LYRQYTEPLSAAMEGKRKGKRKSRDCQQQVGSLFFLSMSRRHPYIHLIQTLPVHHNLRRVGEMNFQIKYRLGAIFRSLLIGLFSIPLYTANINTVATMANPPKGGDAKSMGLKPQHAVTIARLPKTSVHQRIFENTIMPQAVGRS